MLMEKMETSISRAVVNDNMTKLLNSSDAIYGVLLSSIDGLPLAKQAKSDMADSKLSAMTSSCLALGERIALEAQQNGWRNTPA